MIEFLEMVTTRPMILDYIMNGLSATDCSLLLYALRISDPTATMLSYLNFIRDFPEEHDTLIDYIKHGHKIVFMGEGLKRLVDRIEKPYECTHINGDTICIAALVVPTAASIQYIVETNAAAELFDNLYGTSLEFPIRHVFTIKRPNENGVSIFYKYDCEGINGNVVKMMSMLVSGQMFRDLRVWNSESDGIGTFKYVYERAPDLMETTVPVMMYELPGMASEECSNVVIPYYDFTGGMRGLARGWRKQPSQVMPPLEDAGGKRYITIELPIVETDRLIGCLPRHDHFSMGGGSYQCRTWRGGRCYCTDLTKIYFEIPIVY